MTLNLPQASFADVQALVIAHIGLLSERGLGGVSSKLEAVWPYVVVTELPVGGDNYVWAWRMVDVEVFHANDGLAKQFSRVVHAHMMQLRHTYVNGVPVDDVLCPNGFGYSDYGDPTIFRYLAEYEISSFVNAQPL